MVWNSGHTQVNYKSCPSGCQWFQWSQDLCLPLFLAAWWEWVIPTGSAALCWVQEAAQLGTVAFFSREQTSAPTGTACSCTREARLLQVPQLKPASSISLRHIHLDIYPYTRLWLLAPRKCFPKFESLSHTWLCAVITQQQNKPRKHFQP